MRKVLLIPDSFKGTMSSSRVCEILARQIRRFYPEAEIVSIPVADGGEGSVDAFVAAMGGERVSAPVKGPYMEDIQGFFGLVDSGRTAVIEMAACAGLPLVGERRHAEKTTTFGVGQLIQSAVDRGCGKIILGLGGSATNDFGAGAAAALGVRFLDAHGDSFVPVGETLSRIAHIDMGGLHPGLKDVEVVVMCDIDNPLYGEQGAAYVFGPQKGADPEMVRFLDRGLRSVSKTVRRALGVDVSQIPGAGAAGGMGGGMVAFLGARLQMGIETVLDTVDYERCLLGADLVITGEGRIDGQSLRGKVVVGVARRTRARGVPVIAIVGDIGDDIEGIYEEGVTAVFSINRVAVPFSEAKLRCESDLALTAENLMRFLSLLKPALWD